MKQHVAAALKKAITEAELLTDLDFVLVTRRASGNYRDLNLAAASIGAWAWLAFVVYSSASFYEMWWPLETFLVYMLVWAFLRKYPLWRYLPLRTRFAKQVEDGARAAFVAHGIDRTRHRLGVLIYISHVEGEARILPDHGAQAGLAPGTLLEFQRLFAETGGNSQLICRQMELFAQYCAHVFPRTVMAHELSDEADDS